MNNVIDNNNNYKEQLGYWISMLENESTLLELPTDYKRSNTHVISKNTMSFVVEMNLLDSLNKLSKQINVSIEIIMLSVFNVILYRYTDQNTIIVGIPFAFNCLETTDCDYLKFNNIIPIQSNIYTNTSFLSVVREISQSIDHAKNISEDKSGIMLNKILNEYWKKNIPLFNTVFDIDGLSVNNSNSINTGQIYDLYMSYNVVDDHYNINIEYNSLLFNSVTIERFSEHFINILQTVVLDESIEIPNIQMLSDNELHMLTDVFNDTKTEYYKHKTLPELFVDQVKRTPYSIALVYTDKEITYNELDIISNKIAHYLVKIGVKNKDIIAVSMDRTDELIVVLLGILKSGAAYAPIDISSPNDRLEYILRDTDAKVVITNKSRSNNLLYNDLIEVCYDEIIKDNVIESLAPIMTDITSDDVAYVMYTSGTTGNPKGVLVSHKNINRLVSNTNYAEFTYDDVFLHFSPISFDASTFEIWGALINGAKLVVAESGLVTLEELSNTITDYNITTLWLTAALFHQMVDYYPDVLLKLKQLLSGGDVLSTKHVIKLLTMNPGLKLINGYGPTEGTTFSCCKTILLNELCESKSISIGKPISNTQVYILDEALNIQPCGVYGELYIAGDGIAIGYLNNSQLTNQKFITNPFSMITNDRMYRTGDIARYLENGDIEFIGRKDNQVKIRGFRIELDEIEHCIKQHPIVRDVVVKIHKDKHDDKRLIAYIEPDSVVNSLQNDADKEQINQWRSLYEDTYTESILRNDPEFNIIGWNSSYTGLPLLDKEMKDWLDGTIDRIRSLNPKTVLEIGFGTGLLLFKIAPICKSYDGWDFSSKALDYVQNYMKIVGINNANLELRSADNFIGIDNHTYTNIIINSVIQYFPDIDYFNNVLDMSINSVATDGCIFIGDVRNNSLLKMFNSSVEYHKTSKSNIKSKFIRQLEQQIHLESELTISPEYFINLRNKYSQISHVDVLYKRGVDDNELTKYRYDVLIHIDSQIESIDAEWKEWDYRKNSIKQMIILMETTSVEYLAIKNINNPRLTIDNYILNSIYNSEFNTEVSSIESGLYNLNVKGIHPEDWYKGIENKPFDIDVRWSGDTECLYYDVIIFRKGTSKKHINYSSNAKYSNDRNINYYNSPLNITFHNNIIPILREYISNKLPEYMRPSNYMIIPKFPITDNGKIDRKKLPTFDNARPYMSQEYVPPTSDIEIKISIIWEEILCINRIGIYDNFFKLGGHSLLAIQIVSKIISTFELNIEIRNLFEYPTIVDLSTLVESKLNTKLLPNEFV